MAYKKITASDLQGIGVIGLPDTPELSAEAMQEKFEETSRSVIIPAYNALVTELTKNGAPVQSSDIVLVRKGSDGDLQVSVDGKNWTGVATAALNKKADADAVYSKELVYTKTEADSMLNSKAEADSVYPKSNVYTKGETDTKLAGKADKSSVYTKSETDQAISQRVTQIGSADMTKTVYDKDNDGVVDNAQRLGGHLPEHYASVERVKAVMSGESATADGLLTTQALKNSIGKLTVVGKSIQNGTPSIDSPAEIISVGNDGTTELTVGEQSITLPISLNGIAVESGGNWTDEGGQQWIADTAVIKNSVVTVTRNVKKIVTNGSENWAYSTSNNYPVFKLNIAEAIAINSSNQNSLKGCISDRYNSYTWSEISSKGKIGCSLCWGNGIAIADNSFTNVTEFKNYLASNPTTFIYLLNTPTTETYNIEQLTNAGGVVNIIQPDGAGLKVDLSGAVSEAEFEKVKATAEEAMPKSGDEFTGNVSVAQGKYIDFNVKDGTKLRIIGGASTNRATIRLVGADGTTISDIIQVNTETGAITASRLMPKSNFSFNSSTATLNITL